ncbi:hypothetical protein VTJ83DRAFT_6558 [Remersonia thermophila]|uniref:lytic cellulose monooxygenase (C4-dehydrogenating) n=1 Tax=Remersonia thermophila TaxID=72144 RepID=A0ABR4D520_9PEZI
MKYLLAALAAATSVSAHGWVDNATIGGVFYQLYHPYQDPYMGEWAPPRISRKLVTNGPVLDVTSIDLQCGGSTAEGQIGTEPAPLHAPAAAGSQVNLRWTYWPDSHMGPIMTYMARCPDEGCDTWQPGEAPVFFKIHEAGRYTTDKVWPDDIWEVTKLMSWTNEGYNYTIPACLAPGHYLVRHEILALHSAWAKGEAQFYPHCHQLTITSGGNVREAPEEYRVSFPGAYKDDDPGIFFNVWTPGDYTIPGPPVWQCPESE